jgi:hypothetical protein
VDSDAKCNPVDSLVPQRKVGFPIRNAGLLLGLQGTKTARREGISSPFRDPGGCTSSQNSGVRCSSLIDWPVYPRWSSTMPSAARARNPALQSFQTGARLSDRFGLRYWQEARWRPRMASMPPSHPPEGGARLTGRLRGLAGRSGPADGRGRQSPPMSSPGASSGGTR